MLALHHPSVRPSPIRAEPLPQPRPKLRRQFKNTVIPHQPNHIPGAIQNRSAMLTASEVLLQPLTRLRIKLRIQVVGDLADYISTGQDLTTLFF